MSSTHAATSRDEWIVRDPPDLGRLVIRRFDLERDSMALVSGLLRRATAALAEEGVLRADCAGAGHARLRLGEEEACFVALCNGRLVGTITLREPDPVSACLHYRRADVATFHRFGVDPSLQRQGIGRALLSFGNRWAAAHGYLQLALDMPVIGTALLDFFHAQGFSLIDTVRFAGRDYDSAVLSRPTLTGWPCYPMSRVMHRTRGGR
jgi:GNAT superfamily N-acetyltransferase